MESKLIKEAAVVFGAHACGIADVARFEGAPEGFKPKDIFSRCKSVAVFIKQMPTDAILAENPVSIFAYSLEDV